MKTLDVSLSGFVSWKGESYFIGDALSKSRLGLKPLDSGIHEVYFAQQLIGELHKSAPDEVYAGAVKLVA